MKKTNHFPAEPLEILEENKIVKKRLNNKNDLRMRMREHFNLVTQPKRCGDFSAPCRQRYQQKGN